MVRPWKIDKNLLDKFQKCACGCGEDIPYFSSNHTPIRFKKYHASIFHRGEKHGNWKGGRYVNRYVYVKDWDHRNADKSGYVEEHRLIWERCHKACLLLWGVVHHINEIKTDNRIENLQGMTKGQHITHHKTKDTLNKDSCGLCSRNTRTLKRKGKISYLWYLFGKVRICSRCYDIKRKQRKKGER